MVLNAAERAVWRSMRERNEVTTMALALAQMAVEHLANVNAGGALSVRVMMDLQDQLLELAHRWEQVTKNDDRDPVPADERDREAHLTNFKTLAGMLMSYANRSEKMMTEALRTGGQVQGLDDLSQRQARLLTSIKALKVACDK